VNNSFIYR